MRLAAIAAGAAYDARRRNTLIFLRFLGNVPSRLRYYGHVMRMNVDSIVRTVLEFMMTLGSAGRIGRPLRNWVHCVEEDLRCRGKPGLHTAAKLAREDRDAYRRKIVLGKT